MCIARFQVRFRIVRQATRVVKHLTHPGDKQSDDGDNRELDSFTWGAYPEPVQIERARQRQDQCSYPGTNPSGDRCHKDCYEEEDEGHVASEENPAAQDAWKERWQQPETPGRNRQCLRTGGKNRLQEAPCQSRNVSCRHDANRYQNGLQGQGCAPMPLTRAKRASAGAGQSGIGLSSRKAVRWRAVLLPGLRPLPV